MLNRPSLRKGEASLFFRDRGRVFYDETFPRLTPCSSNRKRMTPYRATFRNLGVRSLTKSCAVLADFMQEEANSFFVLHALIRLSLRALSKEHFLG
jgi:hypothetical protein